MTMWSPFFGDVLLFHFFITHIHPIDPDSLNDPYFVYDIEGRKIIIEEVHDLIDFIYFEFKIHNNNIIDKLFKNRQTKKMV